jgi:hypothetical protein
MKEKLAAMTSFHSYITAATALCLGDGKFSIHSFIYVLFFLPHSTLHCVVKVQISISLKLTFKRIVHNYENFISAFNNVIRQCKHPENGILL